MQFSKVLFLFSLIPSAFAANEYAMFKENNRVLNETDTIVADVEESTDTMVADVAESVLEALEAVEDTTTGITSGLSGLVTQIKNEIYGTEAPTAAPTVYVKPETPVDQVIGQITDTVNTIAEASGNVLNAMNESPTGSP